MLRLATGRLKSGAVSTLSNDGEAHAIAIVATSDVVNAISRRLVEKPREMRSTGLRMRI